MKKTALILFGISVFAGASYVAFVSTPVGKTVLGRYLEKKWISLSELSGQKLNSKKIRSALSEIDYEGHELLVRLTIVSKPIRESRKEGNTPSEKHMKRLATIMKEIKANDSIMKSGIRELQIIELPN